MTMLKPDIHNAFVEQAEAKARAEEEADPITMVQIRPILLEQDQVTDR